MAVSLPSVLRLLFPTEGCTASQSAPEGEVEGHRQEVMKYTVYKRMKHLTSKGYYKKFNHKIVKTYSTEVSYKGAWMNPDDCSFTVNTQFTWQQAVDITEIAAFARKGF